MTKKAQNIKVTLRRIMSSKCIRILIDFFILILLAVIVFRNWIFSSEWPAGGDVMGWISRAYLWKDFRWLYVWRPWSFGFPEEIHSIDLFMSFIYYICNNAALTVKIFTFLSFLIAGFTIYAFTYSYTKRNLAAFSATVVYCFNPWLFSQLTEAHVDILFSYALAPLIFLLLDRALKKGGLKNMIILSFGLSLLITGFHRQCAIIYGFFLFLSIIFFLIDSLINRNFLRGTKCIMKTIIPSLILALLISAPTLLPLTILDIPYYSATFGYPLEDAIQLSYQSMIDALTLGARESWGYVFLFDIRSEIGLPDFPTYLFSLLIFALTFFVILFHRNRYTIFFLVAALMSAFIAKGPNPPFGGIFLWIWSNIPYFTAFRAVSRLAAIIAFSLAFMVSVLVTMLADYIQRSRKAEKEKIYIKAEVKFRSENKTEEVYISADTLNIIIKGARRLIRAISLLIIFLIILNSIFSCFHLFIQGLQVYTPPEIYLEPYILISSQPGDYKVITISNSLSEWMKLLGMSVATVESDFACGAMFTSVGASHDIGFDSSFIHDKPTLQDGGWSRSTRFLIDHLRFRTVRFFLTDDFLKILGPFNYKYVVLPKYLANETRIFFLSQNGYTIFCNGSALILQNNYYTPRFFTPSNIAYVIGGLETFDSLCKLVNFNLNQTALLFHYNTKNLPSFTTTENTDLLILVNSDLMDMVLTPSLRNAIFIEAATYGMESLNHTKYWCRSPFWRHIGCLVFGGDTLTTCGKNSISIPFKIKSSQFYEVWIRIGFADYRGKLSVKIDGRDVGEIKPFSAFWSGLKWVKIATLSLGAGEHTITLTNDGKGYNDIDSIAIVEPQILQSKIAEVLDALKRFNGRIIYDLEAEEAFAYNLPNNWLITIKPYEGYVLSIKSYYTNVSPIGKASASSSGTWGDITLWSYLANDGNPATRWASKPHEPMPQWLMIEWDAPQKINGIRILFERAYAVDYRVQTWNGTEWIDQVVVEGNDLLERIHMFDETVETTKLRIYITRVTELYDLVSVWEIEAFTTPILPSTKLFILKDGYYKFALRLIREEEWAAPFVVVDDQTIILQQSNFTESIVWYEGEPIYLKKGEHEIRIGSLSLPGKMSLDQIIIYSLRNENEEISVNSLFKPSASLAPHVGYEKISPCEYKVHIENSTGPFILAFSESYHPLWRAYIDGEEIEPIPLYSIVNGFYINKTGDFNIKIYFKGQDYAENGLKISSATLILAVLMLVTPWSKIQKFIKNEKFKLFNR
jgi:hypothetical protein